jgi:fatty acid desaturase
MSVADRGLSLSDSQQAAVRDLHRRRGAYNLVGLGFAALWAASAAFTLHVTGAAKLLGFVASGVALHALGILMHEGVHGAFFASPVLNRWVGFACSAPVLLAGSAYRAYHLPHHRHVRGAEDPDEFENVTRRPGVLKLLLVLWLLMGSPFYLVYIPIVGYRRGTQEARRAILTEYLLIACLVAAAVSLVPPRALVDVWLAPFCVALLFGQVRGFTEHIFTAGDAPVHCARTITSNRVTAFLMLNLNYHLDHHLYPGVPWYNLPRLHAVLRDELRRVGAPVSRSYCAFLWEVAKMFPRKVPGPVQGPESGYYLHYMPVLPAIPGSAG